jgi:hypothetical protein
VANWPTPWVDSGKGKPSVGVAAGASDAGRLQALSSAPSTTITTRTKLNFVFMILLLLFLSLRAGLFGLVVLSVRVQVLFQKSSQIHTSTSIKIGQAKLIIRNDKGQVV